MENLFMQRCFELASHGLGRTRPNPLVGCVIVKDGRIISEGYHQQHGGYHAERNAILHCPHPNLLEGSTLYCNLEPCSHHGLTPPCADLIGEHKIAKVVCCNDDPNPKVDGKGFRILEEAGIEVERHVMEREGRFLNRRFFTVQEQHRPYIILKWAESADGFLAPDHAPYWITNPVLKQLSHKWRTQEAAILIGSETFLADRPQLNARLWSGNDPKPVVLDRRGRLGNVPEHWLHLRHETIQQVVAALQEEHLQSVIVEGGRQILDAFLQVGLWDEIRLLRGAPTYGSGIKAPVVDLEPARVEHYRDNSVSYFFHPSITLP